MTKEDKEFRHNITVICALKGIAKIDSLDIWSRIWQWKNGWEVKGLEVFGV